MAAVLAPVLLAVLLRVVLAGLVLVAGPSNALDPYVATIST